jgi:hypothetical protein
MGRQLALKLWVSRFGARWIECQSGIFYASAACDLNGTDDRTIGAV